MHQPSWVHRHLQACNFVFDPGWRRQSRGWCVHQLFAGRFIDNEAYQKWRVSLYPVLDERGGSSGLDEEPPVNLTHNLGYSTTTPCAPPPQPMRLGFGALMVALGAKTLLKKPERTTACGLLKLRSRRPTALTPLA